MLMSPYDSTFKSGGQYFCALALWLLRFPFLLKGKLVARKQGRYAEKASAGKEIHSEIPPCFRKMRRAYRAPGSQSSLIDRAPLQRFNHVVGEKTACPPGPKNDARLM